MIQPPEIRPVGIIKSISAYVKNAGRCNGCRSEFPFRIMEVDHINPRSAGGADHVENLQLLCAHCNRVKGDRPQEYLVARLREMGMAA